MSYLFVAFDYTMNQNNQSIKSDKERIKALEAENARLKYELSFYNDFMEEMRKIAKPNRSVKKNKQIGRASCRERV